MSIRWSLVLGLFLALPLVACGQAEPPLYETRAVWLATVLRDGDWPRVGTSAETQARELRQLIQDAHALGINTFMFQVVARGDALYPSTRLPWSPKPEGAGEDPGYDPLQVAIDEAHRLGMELHAWFNVFRVGDSGTLSTFDGVSDPTHVAYANPGWVVNLDGDLWLDPSSEDARAWLVDNVMEIVTGYDVDAVHFDFIRYPQGGLPDDGTRFQFDDRGFDDIGDWRRDNVSQFVRDAYAAILSTKPWVKVGSAPIGRYNGSEGDFVGYNGVFQASREWLATGVSDYLAPQIYWNISDWPYFDELAEEWVDESAGLPIYTGIGAYRPEVQAELTEIIEASRAAGAEGQAYFRYDHMMQVASTIEAAYATPALTTPMTHRFEAAVPSTPQGLALDTDGLTVTLTWNDASGATTDPLRAYAIYRRASEAPDVQRAEDLLAVIGPDVPMFSETFDESPEEPMVYRVAAVSKLGIVSDGSEAVTTPTVLAGGDETVPQGLRLEAPYPNPVQGRALVAYELGRTAQVTLEVIDVLGRHVATLVNGAQAPGSYEQRLDATTWAPGVYLLVLHAEGRRQTRRLVVTR